MSQNHSKSSGKGCLVSIGITILFGILFSQFYDVNEKTDSMTNSSWLVCSALFIGWMFALVKFAGSGTNLPTTPESKNYASNSYQDIDDEFRREDERLMEDGKDAARDYDPRDHMDIDETDLR